MPKSHDSKPRNKDRRAKWRNEQRETENRQAQRHKPKDFIGPVLTLAARKQSARRLLRKHYQTMVKAQRELEKSLRRLGISWRELEKAVTKGGKWSELSEGFLTKFFEEQLARAA